MAELNEEENKISLQKGKDLFNQRCDFVLSDTMFSHTDTLIRRRQHKELEIIYDKTEYHCSPLYEKNRFTVITWAQD